MNSGPAVKSTVKASCIANVNTNKSLLNKSMLAAPLLIIIDLLAIALSILVSYSARVYILPTIFPNFFETTLLADTFINLWWLPIVIIGSLAYEDLYQKRLPYWKEVEKILRACSLALIVTVLVLYLMKLGGEISRTLVLLTWVMTVIFIPAFRYLGKLLLVRLQILNKPIIILGAGVTGKLIVKALNRERTMGYSVIGFLDDNVKENVVNNIPIVGCFKDAEQIIIDTKVDEVIIAVPGLASKQLVELTNRLQPLVNNVMVVPDLFGLAMNGIEVEYFFNEQALLLNVKNKFRSNTNRFIKRMSDIIAGTIVLIICIPIMMIIAIAIKLDSKGPVLFKQERIGSNCKQFICFKFRTMHTNADILLEEYLNLKEEALEEWRTYNKLRGYDPRVTRVGSLLRRFSLDELPQLVNVIIGEMSLVGPRPYLQRESKQMGSFLYDISVAKPGITGLWQVSGRNKIDFNGRLNLDTWYVRNWSLWLDLIILIRTIKVLINRDGAY